MLYIPREKTCQNTPGIPGFPKLSHYTPGIPGYNLWADFGGLRPSFRFILFTPLPLKARQGALDLQIVDSSACLHQYLALKAGDRARMRQIKVFKAVSPRAPSFARVAKPRVCRG